MVHTNWLKGLNKGTQALIIEFGEEVYSCTYPQEGMRPGALVGFLTGVGLGVFVGILMGVGLGVGVGVWVGVGLGVFVGVWVGMGLGVFVGIWLGVGLEVRLVSGGFEVVD